jgi:hypothetical protein
MENVKRNKFIQILKGFWDNEAGEVSIEGMIKVPKLEAESIYDDTAKPNRKKFGISSNKGNRMNNGIINKGNDERTIEKE